MTEHLVREFRVTKTLNKDSTIGIFRELQGGGFDEDFRAELGLCCVVEARVAPDHAKVDGHLGPRTYLCDVVLCLGEIVRNKFKFGLVLCRGRGALIKSVLDFLKRYFGGVSAPVNVAPHHLVFLAREWTRDIDDESAAEDEIIKSENRRFKRLTKLEIAFTLPPVIINEATSAKDLESVHVTIEEESLRNLHDLVEKQHMMDIMEEEDGRKDPALVTALTRHISKHLNIDLTGTFVTMISTPTAELSSDGKVRFLWPSHLKRALLHLQEVSKTKAEEFD